MTINEVANAAAQFTLEQKALLVARLSFELTIAARNTYIPGTEDVAEPRQIRAYNEMQHRVAACVCELLSGTSTEVWLWDYIDEAAEVAGCRDEVTGACVRAFGGVNRVSG
jgi:hypothetical protein